MSCAGGAAENRRGGYFRSPVVGPDRATRQNQEQRKKEGGLGEKQKPPAFSFRRPVERQTRMAPCGVLQRSGSIFSRSCGGSESFANRLLNVALLNPAHSVYPMTYPETVPGAIRPSVHDEAVADLEVDGIADWRHVTQWPPPRPRPSSATTIVMTSILFLRRRVLV